MNCYNITINKTLDLAKQQKNYNNIACKRSTISQKDL